MFNKISVLQGLKTRYFNLVEFFVGYASYWDMTYNYKTNLSIQDNIFRSCTFTPLLWFINVKNVNFSSFSLYSEFTSSLFYRLKCKLLI